MSITPDITTVKHILKDWPSFLFSSIFSQVWKKFYTVIHNVYYHINLLRGLGIGLGILLGIDLGILLGLGLTFARPLVSMQGTAAAAEVGVELHLSVSSFSGS